MNLWTKLLIAALHMEAEDIPIFTTEELTVAAWKKFPKEFGLKGYNLPDNNKVTVCLSGKKGTVRQGHMHRPAKGQLALTEKGRAYALPLALKTSAA
jgi:hypothetical protein